MKKSIIIAVLAISILLLASCDRQAAEPLVIRFATTATYASLLDGGSCPMSVAKNFFLQEIESRSNGRITVLLFADGQLGATMDSKILGVHNNTVDMFAVYHAGWYSVTRAFIGFNVPYLFQGYDDVWAVLDSEIGQSWLDRAGEDTGVRPMAFFDVGFRHLTSAFQPVTDPQDVVGVRMRTMPDDIHIAIWEGLGAEVTPVPWVGLYTALSHGLVDMMDNTFSNIVQGGFHAYHPYITLTNHNYTSVILAAGSPFWEGLSAADQELIAQVVRDAQQAGREKALVTEEMHMQYLLDAGISITDLTPAQFMAFQEATESSWLLIRDLMGHEEFDRLVDFVANCDQP